MRLRVSKLGTSYFKLFGGVFNLDFACLYGLTMSGVLLRIDYDLDIEKAEQGYVFKFKPVSPKLEEISGNQRGMSSMNELA